ncbi:MAG: response regulator [Cellvibrionaceae bacterium]|nr:response regulator [Cellvibrionaceae bacterium]
MSDITVMIVDDAEDNRMLQRMILEDHYRVVEAVSGEDCLEQVARVVPSLFLLDVNMSGMDGYQVCTQLRKHPATATTPIIFVSAMYKPDERLAGYEAGGDDYLVKPIDGELLLEKVQYHLESHIEIAKAQNEAKESMNVALEAMTYSSEIGQLIDFVKQSQTVKSLEDMGDKVCAAAEEFGLNACALVTGADRPFAYCEADSLEAKVLKKVQSSEERIINVGVRTIVKSDQICLLIKNMPTDDESRYGRIKDHLAVLVSICDGRLLALQAQKDLAGQRKEVLEKVILVTEEKLEEFNIKLSAHDNNVREIMMDMIGELEAKLFSLGLDEDQEAALMALAYRANEQLNGSREATTQLEGELGIILEGLYNILDSSGDR